MYLFKLASNIWSVQGTLFIFCMHILSARLSVDIRFDHIVTSSLTVWSRQVQKMHAVPQTQTHLHFFFLKNVINLYSMYQWNNREEMLINPGSLYWWMQQLLSSHANVLELFLHRKYIIKRQLKGQTYPKLWTYHAASNDKHCGTPTKNNNRSTSRMLE